MKVSLVIGCIMEISIKQPITKETSIFETFLKNCPWYEFYFNKKINLTQSYFDSIQSIKPLVQHYYPTATWNEVCVGHPDVGGRPDVPAGGPVPSHELVGGRLDVGDYPDVPAGSSCDVGGHLVE